MAALSWRKPTRARFPGSLAGDRVHRQRPRPAALFPEARAADVSV